MTSNIFLKCFLGVLDLNEIKIGDNGIEEDFKRIISDMWREDCRIQVDWFK